jgi:hypothetical protein
MSLLHFGTPGDNSTWHLLLYCRHRLAAVDHLREASVVIQGDAVKSVVWAAILSLVLGLTSGPDPSPPLSKLPGQVSRFLPSQENTVSTFVSALILGSENYINSRVETAVTRGVYRLMSPLWSMCPIVQ